MSRIFLAALATLALGACASTSTKTASAAKVDPVPAAAPMSTAMAEAEDDNEMVCKRQAVVGSNFKRKICATRAQWRQSEEDSRMTTGNLQRRGANPGVTN